MRSGRWALRMTHETGVFCRRMGDCHERASIRHRSVRIMITASGLLGGPAYYLHWGVIQISLTNFLIIVAMVVIFVLALVLPFPGGRDDLRMEDHDDRE